MSTLPVIVQMLIYFLVGWLVVGPICTFQHESGHAIIALLLTGHRVTIQLGKRGISWRVRLGRLTILWYLGFGAVWGVYQLEDQGKTSPNRNIWIILGGPAASLLFTVLFGSLAALSDWAALLVMFTIGNLIMVLNTGLPWTYPKWMGIMGGIPSDVLRAWRLIKRSSRVT